MINTPINSLNKSWVSTALLSIPLFLLLTLCLSIPLWGNILMGIGSLAQTSKIYDFPISVFQSEYIRGFFYKTVLLGLMQFSDMFSSRNEYLNYQLVLKSIYYLGCLGMTIAFVHWAFKEYLLSKKIVIWSVVWIVLLGSTFRQFMEAEELAAILAVCHVLSIASNQKWLHLVSGLFVFLLLGCKSITILYTGFGLLYLLLFCQQDKTKIKTVILSHVGFTILTTVLYLTWLKPEVNNTILAMTYQNSLQIDFAYAVNELLVSYSKFLPYIPSLILVPFIFVVGFFLDWKVLLFFAGGLLIASAAVILQNRFTSPYHYMAFIDSILCFYLIVEKHSLCFAITKNNVFKKYLSVALNNSQYIWIVFVSSYAIFQISNSDSYFIKASNRLFIDFSISQQQVFSEINYALERNSPNDLLLIGSDCPSYYFMQRKTAGNKVSAITLNRSLDNDKWRESQLFKDYFSSIMSYQGNFILIDDSYIKISDFPMLQEKINTEYNKLRTFNNAIEIFPEAQHSLYLRKNS